MTKKEQDWLIRFTRDVNKSLTRIERNIRMQNDLHAFEVQQLKTKLARATQRSRTRRAAR